MRSKIKMGIKQQFYSFIKEGVDKLAIKTAFFQTSSELEYYGYMCSCCGRGLGAYERIGKEEHDDTEGWNFCPYCGSEL